MQLYYSIGISLAGTDEKYAKSVSAELKRMGHEVYYYKEHPSESAGENLSDYLSDIYTRCNFCIIFLSDDYANKKWTLFESDVINKRGKDFEPLADFLIPVKAGDINEENIEKIELSGIKYIPRSKNPKDTAKYICNRIEEINHKHRLNTLDAVSKEMLSHLKSLLLTHKISTDAVVDNNEKNQLSVQRIDTRFTFTIKPEDTFGYKCITLFLHGDNEHASLTDLPACIIFVENSVPQKYSVNFLNSISNDVSNLTFTSMIDVIFKHIWRQICE